MAWVVLVIALEEDGDERKRLDGNIELGCTQTLPVGCVAHCAWLSNHVDGERCRGDLGAVGYPAFIMFGAYLWEDHRMR